MNKERLEEIEAIEQEVANGFEIEDLNLNTMTVVNREHFEWLKEQAERVENLERDFMYYFKIANELDHQNKRYREALELIRKKGTYGTSINTGEIVRSNEADIADEALEGESK